MTHIEVELLLLGAGRLGLLLRRLQGSCQRPGRRMLVLGRLGRVWPFPFLLHLGLQLLPHLLDLFLQLSHLLVVRLLLLPGLQTLDLAGESGSLRA